MGTQLGQAELSAREVLFARFDVAAVATDLLAEFAGTAAPGIYDHTQLVGHDSPVVGIKILNEGLNPVYIARVTGEAVVAGPRTDTIAPRASATAPAGSGGVWIGAVAIRWLVRAYSGASGVVVPGLFGIADGGASEITLTAYLF